MTSRHSVVAPNDGHAPLDTDKIVGRSKLLGELRDLIRRRHDRIRTEQAYLQWAKRFILFPANATAIDPRSGNRPAPPR